MYWKCPNIMNRKTMIIWTCPKMTRGKTEVLKIIMLLVGSLTKTFQKIYISRDENKYHSDMSMSKYDKKEDKSAETENDSGIVVT